MYLSEFEDREWQCQLTSAGQGRVDVERTSAGQRRATLDERRRKRKEPEKREKRRRGGVIEL